MAQAVLSAALGGPVSPPPVSLLGDELVSAGRWATGLGVGAQEAVQEVADGGESPGSRPPAREVGPLSPPGLPRHLLSRAGGSGSTCRYVLKMCSRAGDELSNANFLHGFREKGGGVSFGLQASAQSPSLLHLSTALGTTHVDMWSSWSRAGPHHRSSTLPR